MQVWHKMRNEVYTHKLTQLAALQGSLSCAGRNGLQAVGCMCVQNKCCLGGAATCCRDGQGLLPRPPAYTHTSGLVCECRQNSLKLLHRLVYCCGCFLQLRRRRHAVEHSEEETDALRPHCTADRPVYCS